MLAGLKRIVVHLSFCLFHQIGCCFRPKKYSLRQFRRQYKLLDQIGRGGFGCVYQGYRIADSLPIAVKFVRHRQVTDWTLLGKELVPSEIRFLEDCQDCKGVVRLVGWFSSRRAFLIVMERPQRFLDLFDLLNNVGRLDEQMARAIFGQIVKTVMELHQKHSVVHRDIKDENIVLDLDTGKAFLCDFGAAEFEERAKFRQFQGTKSYCPPEVFKRKCYLPTEGTVWSLGILFYTMLVGYPPFRNAAQICMGRVQFPDYISQDCRSLIQSCLCPIPECRIPLEQLQAHKFLLTTSSESGNLPKKIHKLLKEHERGSFGTGRTESDEDEEEEECSYRASNAGNEAKPISIPMDRLYMTEEWTSASSDHDDIRFRPDSGFYTSSSEAIFHRVESFYENLTGSGSLHEEEEMATAASTHSSSNLFGSAYSSSYYSLGESMQEFVKSRFLGDQSSVESIYLSTSSVGQVSPSSRHFIRFEEVEEEEDITMVEEQPANKIGYIAKDEDRESLEDDETIRINLEFEIRNNN